MSARDIPQDIFLPPSVREEGKENQKGYTPERHRDRANRILADVQYRAFAIYREVYTHLQRKLDTWREFRDA